VEFRTDESEDKSETGLDEILNPCAENYFVCNATKSESQCLSEFDQCSVSILSDKNKTDGVVPPELTESIDESSKDETLPSSLLQCILDNHDCIDDKSKKSNCMADYNACALKALEDFQNRRLRLLNGDDDGDDNPLPASRASDETEVEELNKYLSGNFTSCVQVSTL
jgi:hypothetical protein